jgi:hypothetical protein
MKRLFLILGSLLAASSSCAWAQQYPVKPIRFVAPFAPGGGTDFIARVAAQKLTEAVKQQVIVENRPGAGGTLGAELGARAAPDGYTFTVIAGSYAVNPSIYKLAFDPVNDITPVIQFSQGPLLIVVHPALPIKSMKDLIALARSKPGGLSYASSGQGSIVHLSTELFLYMAKVKAVHIPYKGTGPAITDTMSGQTQFLFGSIAAVMPIVKQGRLRGIAVTTAPGCAPRRAHAGRIRRERLRRGAVARAGRAERPGAPDRGSRERRDQQGTEGEGHGGQARNRRRVRGRRHARAVRLNHQARHRELARRREARGRQGRVTGSWRRAPHCGARFFLPSSPRSFSLG